MLRLRGQKTPNDCAIACMQNAMALRGKIVGRKRIIRAAVDGDVSMGVDGPEIVRALVHFGRTLSVCNTSEPATAREWARKMVKDSPIIWSTRDWGHWELSVGGFDNRLVIHDPETGYYVATFDWWVRNWPCDPSTPRRVGAPRDGRFYAVAVL